MDFRVIFYNVVLDLSANSTRPVPGGESIFDRTGCYAQVFYSVCSNCSNLSERCSYPLKKIGTWKKRWFFKVFKHILFQCSNVPIFFKVIYILYVTFYILFYFFLSKIYKNIGTLVQTAFWNIKNIDFTGFFVFQSFI